MMQIKTYADYPQKTGIITGFCNARTEYLELIKADLGLFMSLQSLCFIQIHYKDYEKRDPHVEELVMLDILMWNAREREEKKTFFSLIEMSTNSDDIRITFEDVMHKLAALQPTRKGFVEFETLMNVSGNYMGSIFPERYRKGHAVCRAYEDDPVLLSKLDGAEKAVLYKIGDMSFAVAEPSERKRVSIKEGVYIQIEKNDAAEELVDALRAEDIVFSASIACGSIIEAIVSDTENAEIIVPVSLPSLATFGDGDLLILCRAEDEQKIVQLGSARLLRMRHAGRKMKKGGIRFKNHVFEYAVSACLIKKLTENIRREAVVAFVGNDLLEGEAGCHFEAVNANEDNENIIITSAASDLSSPYEGGIAQTVCAAAGAIALGASLNEIKLKSIIKYPSNGDASDLFAHILGIYRAEMELCISSEDNELIISSDASAPVSRTVAIADKKGWGGLGEGALWIVSPQEKDGKLCFENVRRVFSYMTAFISEGHAIRACALDSDGFSGADKEQKTPIGSFLVLTRACLVPCDGVKTEKVGAVGIDIGGEELSEI